MTEPRAKYRILLIQPSYELEIRWIVDEQELGIKADYLPLGIATIAALTPPDEFAVDLWDELVRGSVEDSDLDIHYDIVGITSLRANIPRARKIAELFRHRGSLVVIGGPGVSGTPDRCRGHFDVLFIGECELTWPRFLTEWRAGCHQGEYRQIDKPDMFLSPPPCWDSVLPYLKHYAMGCVQTTRGCPFDCDFCDVIYLNGRRQRHKSTEQVFDEIRTLERMGMRTIMFNDDNLTADRRWCKEFLRELIPLNNSFKTPLRYATQASIDLVQDRELVELLADANFYQMLVGIETPNEEALRDSGKRQNLKGDLLEQIHTLLSYGMVVRGGMIVGFDTDELDIFERQYQFIQQAYFPSVSLHMLNAPMGTRLWRKLRADGRVIDPLKITGHVTQRLFNNIIPKRMSRVDLMRGFRELYLRVFSWPSFEERMINWIGIVRRPPNVEHHLESADKLAQLGPSLGLEPAACQSMERIFRYTEQQAPFMLGRVKEVVIQFVKYAQDANGLMPKLTAQIELESAGQLQFEQDHRPVTVPPAFRDDYKAIFRDIYRRLYLNLDDKNRLPEALVSVFVDFLVHEHEGGLEVVAEHHLTLLREMADRICAELNGIPPEELVPIEDENIKVPSAAKQRLGDDVLIAVEQELLKIAHSQASQPSSLLAAEWR